MKDGGMLVSIGTESVVIIDQPVIDGKEVDIVEDISGQGYTFAPSGLQGISGKPNYRINPKYIVGYVDKLNNQVIANHLYYNYEILQENLDQVENNPKENQTIMSNKTLSGSGVFLPQEIGKATINASTESKEKAQSQIQREQQAVVQKKNKRIMFK